MNDVTDEPWDDQVHEHLRLAADRVRVDVDAEWTRFVHRLHDEGVEVATLTSPAAPDRKLPRLLAVAAAVVLLLLLIGRPVVDISVTAARFVQAVVEADDAPTTPPPTTTTTTVVPPTTTALPAPTTMPLPPPPPPTTTAPPPPPTTTTTAAPAVDAGHDQLRNGTDFERGIRQVHIQINEAIGFQRSNYAALDGAPELVERLLGRRPEFDARLRDALGHLRQAQRAQDRNAASAAHTIIVSIEQELGTAGKR